MQDDLIRFSEGNGLISYKNNDLKMSEHVAFHQKVLGSLLETKTLLCCQTFQSSQLWGDTVHLNIEEAWTNCSSSCPFEILGFEKILHFITASRYWDGDFSQFWVDRNIYLFVYFFAPKKWQIIQSCCFRFLHLLRFCIVMFHPILSRRVYSWLKLEGFVFKNYPNSRALSPVDMMLHFFCPSLLLWV